MLRDRPRRVTIDLVPLQVPIRQLRAVYTPETITVYQAYPMTTALAAAKAGRFVPPFKRDRMTWLKPSFLWMMFRSQWADPDNQERVLAVEMTREGFEWALAHSCLAQYDHTFFPDREQWAAMLSSSPVRTQWEHEHRPRLPRCCTSLPDPVKVSLIRRLGWRVLRPGQAVDQRK